MKNLLPLEFNCKCISYKREYDKTRVELDERVINKKSLRANLEWLRKNKVVLYYPPESNIDFVYYFEYKNDVCKFSACTLKIFFLSKSNSACHQYKLDDKLLRILRNSEQNEIDEISKQEFIELKIDLKDRVNRVTEKQVSFIISLLESNNVVGEVNQEQLKLISKKQASIMIGALKNNSFKNIRIIPAEPTEKKLADMNNQEIDAYLDTYINIK